ncbi:hypothetical protein Bca4012_055596 [Brassica carinata]
MAIKSDDDDQRRRPPVTNGELRQILPIHVDSTSDSSLLLPKLYFKGLVSEEIGTGKGKMNDVVAGFGVSICDQRDNLLFETNGQLVGRSANGQGVEIQALTRG